MSRLLRSGCRLRRDQRGMTLVDLMIAMMIMVVVTPIAAAVMVNTLRVGQANEQQSQVIDELRQQMYAVSRELRSASCMKIPTQKDVPGDTLRFTTESQVGSLSSAYDVRYQVTDSRLVRTQYTYDSATGQYTEAGTRIIGPGLVSPATTFELRSTPRKSIIVKLQLQLAADRPVQQLTTTIAGRNAWQVAC